jgi:hypothetical protein
LSRSFGAKKETLDLLEGKPKRKKSAKKAQRPKDLQVIIASQDVPTEDLPPLQLMETIMGATGIGPMTSCPASSLL